MQFQTSDEHPNSNQSNCFLPSTLSGESAASSETCLQQGLFGRNNRMIPPSPRPIRFWRGSYTSRHELLFFPNDELDWPCGRRRRTTTVHVIWKRNRSQKLRRGRWVRQ
ncbi:uncharacterized protein Gasu_21820 [Galdieria sulphuraria]|uniref:Uncharacterized protein n=1 Tax=Galdieria sulphuraria TaxID=130081 RepID=M2X2A6_GALSU|nr:uncharacterized protein Gasu_21820 [Galdieria sulphuraria]EME30510.1 hypothetical protein Gasu_21820 [Galdieria sulphuraria]|eukprot:XP_005707030.1 hypothetical protein Gasu_21820 [Galdieria sulphuraria]